ncbi:MAG: VOC family protein [Halobacteriales archaeon]|nr:VOC family protein [Halobacteriales archaeon]
MSDAAEPAVTAERPDSPVTVRGTDHVTVTGSNVEDTVAFYRDLLGMSLVLRQPNLDQPELSHLFFDTGDGRILTFFVGDERPSRESPPDVDVGQVHHLAFRIEADRLADVKAALADAGHRYSEFDRGAFHSLYTRDNNGLTIELVADKWPVPDDRRGEVLALAHANRVEAGAEFVDDPHMQAAVDELGLDVERQAVPDAPAGTGVDR